MCPNGFHTSSGEPMGRKRKGRLSCLIPPPTAPGSWVPTHQPYCAQPDTKRKEHRTRLQRIGDRLHVGVTQHGRCVAITNSTLLCAPVSSSSQKHPWMGRLGPSVKRLTLAVSPGHDLTVRGPSPTSGSAPTAWSLLRIFSVLAPSPLSLSPSQKMIKKET